MLTKKLPFDAKVIEGIFDNVMDYKIDWELLEKKNVEKELIELIKGFLEFAKEKRLCSFKKKYDYFKGRFNLLILIGFKWKDVSKETSVLRPYAKNKLKKTKEKLNSYKVVETEECTNDTTNFGKNRKKIRFCSRKADSLNISNSEIVKKITSKTKIAENLEDLPIDYF